jgi:hypothetical protein
VWSWQIRAKIRRKDKFNLSEWASRTCKEAKEREQVLGKSRSHKWPCFSINSSTPAVKLNSGLLEITLCGDWVCLYIRLYHEFSHQSAARRNRFNFKMFSLSLRVILRYSQRLDYITSNGDRLLTHWKERSRPNWGVSSAFAWRGWETPRRTAVTLACVSVEIRMDYLPNRSQEHYRYIKPLGKFIN